MMQCSWQFKGIPGIAIMSLNVDLHVDANACGCQIFLHRGTAMANQCNIRIVSILYGFTVAVNSKRIAYEKWFYEW